MSPEWSIEPTRGPHKTVKLQYSFWMISVWENREIIFNCVADLRISILNCVVDPRISDSNSQ